MRDAVWPVVVAATLLHLALVGYFLSQSKQQKDLTALMFVGEKQSADPGFDRITHTTRGDGYDGQYYYLLAQNPFQSLGQRLDHPVRHTRILYPLVCWAFSGGGDRSALIVVMPLVNLAMIAGLTWLGAWYSRKCDRSPWWGFTLPLVLTILAPLLRNLTDPMAYLGAAGLLVAYDRRATGWMIASAAVAVFAREQNLVLAGIVGLATLWQRQWWAAGGLLLVAAAWVGWLFKLHDVYAIWALNPPAGNTAAPFEGIWHWANWQSYHTRMRVIRVSFGAFFVGQALILGYHAVRWRGPVVFLAVGAAGVALAIVAGPAIWDDWWSYVRSLFWLPLAVWLLNVRAGWQPGLWFGVFSLLFLYGSAKVM